MPSAEELRWIQSTANDLNNLLQVISESAEALEKHLAGNPDGQRYLGILRTTIKRATETAGTMVSRGGGQVEPPESAPAPGVPEVEPPPASKFKIGNPAGSRELILMVDDEEFITMLAEQVLSDDGYRVITARNGFQAIEIYRELKDQIALVILDFVMPVMDGADVFAELQVINPKVSVVLSSGFAEQDRLRGMLAKGLRGFIPKPYTQKKLLEQIRQTLDALHAEGGKR
jgi:CheY-like chemotaxis protein